MRRYLPNIIGVYHNYSDNNGITELQLASAAEYVRFDYKNYFSKNIDQFLLSARAVNIAFYHILFPCNSSWLDNFQKVYSYVGHSFIFCSDLCDCTVEQIKQLDLPNVVIFIPGIISNYKFTHAKIVLWPKWFLDVSGFYHNDFPEMLDRKLLPNNFHKPKYFDILLGKGRPEKFFIYDKIESAGLLESNLVIFISTWGNDVTKHDPYTFSDPNLSYIGGDENSGRAGLVSYYGKIKHLSTVIPIEIYNQTYYTLVTETNYANEYTFYTEKIIKPMLAGRLFVVLAGQYYLKNLRDMGFMTFDGIIDESYDNEPDLEKRFIMALQQVEYLCKQTPQKIYQQAETIINHNKSLANTNWQKQFDYSLATEIKEFLVSVGIKVGWQDS